MGLKRILLVLIIPLLSIHIQAQNGERPKVGLVLSGGGAKGFAHIGVLKILEREGIPIDYIVGTSIGSIIGGLYSIGYNSEQLEDFAHAQDWPKLLADFTSREYKNFYEKSEEDRYLISFMLEKGKGLVIPSGIVQGQNIINVFCRLTAKYHDVTDFNKLPIPFACVAADIETGEEVIIRNGFLPEAMFASMAIPAMFSPSEINGRLAVDGGIVNNFPVDLAREMGADIVIGVDIQDKLMNRDEMESVADIISQLTSLMGHQKYLDNRDKCDVVIDPDISGYGTLSFNIDAADTLISRGESAITKKLDSIKSLMSNNGIQLKPDIQEYQFDENMVLQKFSVNGIEETTIDYLLGKLDFEFPDIYNFKKIEEGINRLYGTSSFGKAYYKILPDEQNVFDLQIKEKSTSFLNAGFNYNSENNASLLLNLTFRNKMLGGARLSFDAILSSNTVLNTSFQFIQKNLPEIGIDLTYKLLDVDIYDRREKMASMDIKYFKTDISASEVLGNNYLMSLGARAEVYRFDRLISSDFIIRDSTLSNVKDENDLLSVFAKVRFDNLDNKYFPTSGYNLYAEFMYSVNSLKDFFNSTKAAILQYNFESAISFGGDVCFLPKLYGRLLLDNNSGEFRNNFIGGTPSTILLHSHLPFVGVKLATRVKSKVLVSSGELRLRIAGIHYLSAIFNAATQFDYFNDWQTREFIFGGGLKYTYNSFIGPIELLISISDYTGKPDMFINIGRWF